MKIMAKLESDWLTKGMMDFEYKKYVLLAYLKHIEGQFYANRLYPHLTEIQLHLDACVQIRENQQTLKSAFPKNVTGVDVESWRFVYEQAAKDDTYPEELDYILDFAIPNLAKKWADGNEILSEVGGNISISPVGIIPLRVEEGYLFFCHSLENLITIFQYKLALYNEQRERYVKTLFVDSVRLGYGRTAAQVKVDLMRKNKQLPNPAAYMVESRYAYPLEETLLPVAKKLILKQLNVA
jgi:hypothetical protein